jgi:protease-4
MRSLLHTFALSIWAIRPEAVAAYMPQVEEVLKGRLAAAPNTRTEKALMEEADLRFVTREGREMRPANEQVEPEPGLVMVLNLSGPVMKEDYCGAAGTTTLSRWLANAEATDEVDGVVLNLDSPGGNGYGMLTMTDQLERMSKPVVSIVQQGMACSAAYGIAAATDHVMAASEVDEFGSIGTYVRLTDWSGYDEQKGIKTHTILASRSTEKLKDYEEALKADPKDPADPHYKAIRENYIDPFNEHFIQLVQRNRPALKDEKGVLAGRVFMANEALRLGLIDSTGQTMGSAIAMVRELAATRNNTNNN